MGFATYCTATAPKCPYCGKVGINGGGFQRHFGACQRKHKAKCPGSGCELCAWVKEGSWRWGAARPEPSKTYRVVDKGPCPHKETLGAGSTCACEGGRMIERIELCVHCRGKDGDCPWCKGTGDQDQSRPGGA